MSAGPPRVAVVGGGITGLAAAYYLEQQARAAGREVEIHLLEEAPVLGGKVQTEQVGELTIEAGPDSYLARKVAATRLAQAVGLGDALVESTPGRLKTYVYHRGRLHPLPEGMVLVAPTRLGPFLASPLISPLGKLRMALDLVLPPRREEGDESIGAFLRRRLGDEAVEVLAGPLLSGIYAGNPDELSLLATFPMFRDLERRHGSLVRGLLRQARGARAPGARGQVRPHGVPAAPGQGQSPGAQATPAQARPSGAPERRDTPGSRSAFVSLRGGLGSLVRAVAGALQVTRVRTGTPVRRLERRPGGLGSPGRYRLVLGDGTTLQADAVILAVPAYAAASLVEPISPGAAGELAAIPYVSTAVVALAYPRGQVPPLEGSGFVVSHRERRSITACTWVSSKWPHMVAGDWALFRCFVGRSGDEELALAPEPEILAAVRRDLAEMMDLRAEPALVRVYRWPRAMPQYRVGHLDRLARIEAALAAEPGIILAGAAYRGVGVPDCISQGEQAARRAGALLGL
ncbi:MAG: protoporphyrinogen oxidase [Firmicutes bacterium]|nr:protoporphyrinogen oxidase [Bacillota bacterium]